MAPKVAAGHWSKDTYLSFQNSKDFNFLSSKAASTPLLPISGSVFTYLLLNRVTQVQKLTNINITNNEYFLAKSVNVQDTKEVNPKRLEVFIDRTCAKRTEVVNYRKVGYNKFSLYNMFSLMKKDRFFLNEKFYQDVLGRRAFNVYRGGVYGYEKNLKILKKYNEYFERQVFLMTEKVDDFLSKNSAIAGPGLGPSVVRYLTEAPVMGWRRNVGGRAFLEVWDRLGGKRVLASRSHLKHYYLDEHSVVNVDDLGLVALKNLRDYEMYFGMIFYKKQIGKYLSRAGVGKGMHLSIFGRNATRFNFLKDVGYTRTGSNYRVGVANHYGLLRSLYTKKHFPKTSLDFANNYTSYSYFNLEKILTSKKDISTIANEGRLNKIRRSSDLVQLSFFKKTRKALTLCTKTPYSISKKVKITKKSKNTKMKIHKPYSDYTLNLRKFIHAGNFKLSGAYRSQIKISKLNFRRINVSGVRFVRKFGRNSVILGLNLKINAAQLRTLVANSLFNSFGRAHNLQLEYFREFTRRSNCKLGRGKFKVHARKFWYGFGKQPFSNTHIEHNIRSPLLTLEKLNLKMPNPDTRSASVRLKDNAANVSAGSVKRLRRTKFTLSSLRFTKREKPVWKKIVNGLLNLKLYTYCRERIFLRSMLSASIRKAEDRGNSVASVYRVLLSKRVNFKPKSRKSSKYAAVVESGVDINRLVKEYSLKKTAVLFSKYLFAALRANGLPKDRQYQLIHRRRPYLNAKYKLYRLSRMFDLGLSERVNARLAIGKKLKKRIVSGTVRGRRALSKYVGDASNGLVGGNLFDSYKNRVGKNVLIMSLGITYSNARRFRVVRDLNGVVAFRYKFLWKKIAIDGFQKLNVISRSATNNLEKLPPYVKRTNPGLKPSVEELFLTRRQQNVNSVLVLANNVIYKKNLKLLKKYMGLSRLSSIAASKAIFSVDMSPHYSRRAKVNFHAINTVTKPKAKPKFKGGLRRVSSRYDLNISELNSKLGFPVEPQLLKTEEHGTDLDSEYYYQKNYVEAGKYTKRMPIVGTNPRNLVVNIPTTVPGGLPSLDSTKQNVEVMLQSSEDLLTQKTFPEYTQMVEILDKKRYDLRNTTLCSGVKFSKKTYKNIVHRFWEADPVLKTKGLDDVVGALGYLSKEKNKLKLWEYDFGGLLGGSMKRLGVYYSDFNKSRLRRLISQRLSFLNRRYIGAYHAIIAKKDSYIKAWGNQGASLRVRFLKSNKKNLYPVRLSGIARGMLRYPSASFIQSLKPYERNLTRDQQAPGLNDVEFDFYRGQMFLFKEVNQYLFKKNFKNQIKTKVFGDDATRRERLVEFKERVVRSKYTRSLYNQFAMRKFPTFWYRISRKKYPLKSQKKEWGIKIPLAERFLFPFPNQVWNTTYDSSVVYYKNIGWLNFTKNIRRLSNLKSFYRYGREHDELLTEIPLKLAILTQVSGCTNEAYDNYAAGRLNGFSPFSHQYGIITSRVKNATLPKSAIRSFFKDFGTETLRAINHKFTYYRDTIKRWHSRMKPLLGYFGIKTYYTYNSYVMRVNNEIKTRRYRSLFHNFAFAFKLNKTEFTKNILQFNFGEFARGVFAHYGVRVLGKEVKSSINFKTALVMMGGALTSKYSNYGYSSAITYDTIFEGKQLPASLTLTNRNYFTTDHVLVCNPIIMGKNDSTFVETYSKFRFRNKILKSNAKLQLHFADAEVRNGFASFSAKNIVW